MTAGDPAVAGLRATAAQKRAERSELLVKRRCLMDQDAQIVAAVNALTLRIKSLDLELVDLAELTGRTRR